MLGQVRQHARAFHRAVEPAGDGEDRVADRLGFEPPHVLPVQELVLRVGGDRLRGLLGRGAARLPVRGREDHQPVHPLDAPGLLTNSLASQSSNSGCVGGWPW